MEDLARELKIVTLLIDAPTATALNENAVLHVSDQFLGTDVVLPGCSEMFGMRWIGNESWLSA